jgi:hypothetical protein
VVAVKALIFPRIKHILRHLELIELTCDKSAKRFLVRGNTPNGWHGRNSDVAYLSKAFSQPTGPGRLWIDIRTVAAIGPFGVIAESVPKRTLRVQA